MTSGKKIFLVLMIIGFCGMFLSILFFSDSKAIFNKEPLLPRFPDKVSQVYDCQNDYYIFRFAGHILLHKNSAHGVQGYQGTSVVGMIPAECSEIDHKTARLQSVDSYIPETEYPLGTGKKYDCGGNWRIFEYAEDYQLREINKAGNHGYFSMVRLDPKKMGKIEGICSEIK